MDEKHKEIAKITAETLPVLEPVYEFGALQVEGQEVFADLRPFFAGKEYVGCDMRSGLGVDKVLNIQQIDLPAEIAGTVIAIATLEHVEFPHKAVEEVYRILKPDGIAAFTSVMDFPIHDYPYDYWRFTPEGFRSLLKPFPSAFVGFAGDELFPHTVVGIGFKGEMGSQDDFLSRFELWKKTWSYPGELPSHHNWRYNKKEFKWKKVIMDLFVPPLIKDFYLKAKFNLYKSKLGK